MTSLSPRPRRAAATRVGCSTSSLSTRTTASQCSTIRAKAPWRTWAGVSPAQAGTQVAGGRVPRASSTASISSPARLIHNWKSVSVWRCTDAYQAGRNRSTPAYTAV